MMKISLEDKVALITGGSRGIGRATSLIFARAGCNVAINCRSDDKSASDVARQAREMGVDANTYQADVADKNQVDAMIEDIIADFTRIDILINNAGIWVANPIDEMTEQALLDTVNVNLLGCFHTCMAVVPHMKRQKSGVIINISSTAGQRGEAFHSPYGATKAAVIGLTKSLASELADHHIRVNCVAPGWAETDMSRPALREHSDEVLSTIPMNRAADPEEMAGPILFMASDMASFVTGEVLNVNGGAVLCG